MVACKHWGIAYVTSVTEVIFTVDFVLCSVGYERNMEIHLELLEPDRSIYMEIYYSATETIAVVIKKELT